MSEDEKYGFLDDAAPEEQEIAPEVVETVAEVPPEPPAAVVPTTTEPEATHVPLAALKAEREKRQAAERRAAEIEQRVQAQLQQQPPEVPAFYEAPEQHIQAVLTQAQQQAHARMVAAFEEDARDSYSDYDEVLAELATYAQSNPHVIPQVWNSPNPAKAAYKLGMHLREMKSAQDPSAMRAKIEAEVRAQIKAEAEAAEKARAAAIAALPPDLSGSRSPRAAEPEPDDSLDSILASRKR